MIIEAGGEFYDEKILGRFDGKINGNFLNNLKESRLSQFGVPAVTGEVHVVHWMNMIFLIGQ